jgi:MFS family permease
LAWYALFCLLLCAFLFFVDRNILTLLVAPVRRDLGINDSQMGLLQGYSFAVFNGLMAAPFGWYADRRSRRNVLILGLTLWGISTLASGFTTTFTQLLVTRMGLGIGEAALAPCAFSLIAGYFPRALRGRAVGAYGIGGFGGIGIAYLVGGAVLAAFRGVDVVNLPVIGSTTLWHAAFITVGIMTLLLALLLFTVREPPRHRDELRAGPGAVTFFGHLQHHGVAFFVVLTGYVCLGIVAIGWFAWLPTYFIREFKMAPIAAGIQVGWVTTLSGILGAIAGGYIADWMARRGVRGGKLPTLAIMFLGWAVCAIAILMSNNATLSLAIVFLFTFSDGIAFTQFGNVMQEMFPAHLRARSIAAWSIATSLFSGLGPLMFGISTDYFFPGTFGLSTALGVVSLPVIVLGLACAWLGRRPYDRARLAVDPTAIVDTEWLVPAAMLIAAKPGP